MSPLVLRVDVLWMDMFPWTLFLVGYETHNRCKLISKFKSCPSSFAWSSYGYLVHYLEWRICVLISGHMGPPTPPNHVDYLLSLGLIAYFEHEFLSSIYVFGVNS